MKTILSVFKGLTLVLGLMVVLGATTATPSCSVLPRGCGGSGPGFGGGNPPVTANNLESAATTTAAAKAAPAPNGGGTTCPGIGGGSPPPTAQ